MNRAKIKLNKQVFANIREDSFNVLEEEAKNRGVKVSILIRQLIEAFVTAEVDF